MPGVLNRFSVSLKSISLGSLLALALLSPACSAPAADFKADNPLVKLVQASIKSGEKEFDHSIFDKLLKKHVRSTGEVNYAALKIDQAKLTAYLDQLASVKLGELKKDESYSLLINAYNAYTLKLIIDNYPLKSIRDLSSPWDQEICKVAGETCSLNFLEHGLLRPIELYADPRMHFAVNCASKGCPLLAAEAYVGSKVSAQLDAAIRKSLRDSRYLQVKDGKVKLTKILEWYGKDFIQKEGDTLAKALIPYAPSAAKKLLQENGDAGIGYLDYDWSLNDVSPRKKSK